MKTFLGQKKEGELSQNDIISKLTKCMVPLIAAIEQENVLLEKGTVSKVEPIVLKKINLIKEFSSLEEDLLLFLKTNKIDESDPAFNKLKDLFPKMEAVSKLNEILLKTNIEIGDKIVELYKNTHTQDTINQFGYNNKGAVSASKDLEKVMPSITLNNKV
jgi:flagellar biosynthesis/type III secretory pathway chaperone